VQIKGKVEIFTPTAVSGWLAVFDQPDQQIRLELLLDGVPVAVAPAVGFRSDVAALGYGDGACQFDLRLTEALTPAEAERLQLRIAGSDLCLELPRGLSWSLEIARALPTRTVATGVNQTPAYAGLIDVPDSLKIFIVGSPRSGTSVLLRAVQSVFGLRAHGESHVIPALAQALYHLRLYYGRFKDDPSDLLIQQLPIERIEAPLIDSIRAFYHEMYEGEGWVDKTPSDEAVHSAPLIRRVFPAARLIVTRRNGIEVVESYRRKFGASFRDACENWVRVMEGITLLRQNCADILEVDQFDLTNASDVVGGRIAGYLGRPELGHQLGVFLASDKQDRLSTHDWKERLTLDDVDWMEEQREEFVRICGPLMHASNYRIWRT